MYVRNPERGDGFGAQFQNIIWCILFAEHNNMEFAYYPTTSMEHNYDNDPTFISKMNDYINISKGYTCGPVPSEEIFQDKNNNIIYPEVETNIDRYHSGIPYEKLKCIFYAEKQNPYDSNYKHMAIHMRRPNKQDDINYRTNTPTAYYLDTIEYVRSTYYGSKPLHIHIYSQGEQSLFKELEGENVFFHLDTDLQSTFTGLVFADILSISAGSFSYTAALLSNARIISPRFWHPPLKNWEVMENMTIDWKTQTCIFLKRTLPISLNGKSS
jgi:hypothetical protein